MVKIINKCRICGGAHLTNLLSLGELTHAGVFNTEGVAPRQPLELIVCSEPGGCGLVQLRHEFDPGIMYGDHYGYRSGLNAMMVNHLSEIASSACDHVYDQLGPNMTVLDIGSNDGTLLGHFKKCLPDTTKLIGIDPSSAKFSEYYDPSIIKSNKFFSAEEFYKLSGGGKADIITSIAMFYDLPNPQEIVENISNILTNNGIWIVEQSYLLSMLGSNSFDTICHEHTEYYSLKQFEWMCTKSNLTIVDMQLNLSNGGSFRLYIKKTVSNPKVEESLSQFKYIESLLQQNLEYQFSQFQSRIEVEKAKLLGHLTELTSKGLRVCCLGASTKGNILLQHYGLGPELLETVAEVNTSKFGMKTPGTKIPIISQDEALREFDHFLVLPWHFKKNFLQNPKLKGKILIFPLPEFEIVHL